MTLGDAAHQLEGAEGVKALAAEFPKHRAVLLGGDLGHCLCTGALCTAVGVNEEHRLALRQLLTGELHHGLLEFKAVDAGGKAHAAVVRKAGGLLFGYVDQVDLTRIGHGLQHLQGVAMVAGVVANGGFHGLFPPCRVQPKSLW